MKQSVMQLNRNAALGYLVRHDNLILAASCLAGTAVATSRLGKNVVVLWKAIIAAWGSR